MSIKRAVSITVVAAVAVGLISCGGNKTAAAPSSSSNSGYSGSTTPAPTTPAQAAASTRGVKMEREECEEKALEFEPGSPLRAAGNATADNEAFATNLALLDARSGLARILEEFVNGLIENYNQQYEKNGSSSYHKMEQKQEGYFEQLLTNTRPICKNTYVKENGEYNVYVAVELGEGAVSKIEKQLSAEVEDNTDFKQFQFEEKMEEKREKYLEKKRNQ